jgi:hypothetical protein
MARIQSSLKTALLACAAMGVVIGGLFVTAPIAFAEDTYPPGWNTPERHLPPSQYHFIPS